MMTAEHPCPNHDNIHVLANTQTRAPRKHPNLPPVSGFWPLRIVPFKPAIAPKPQFGAHFSCTATIPVRKWLGVTGGGVAMFYLNAAQTCDARRGVCACVCVAKVVEATAHGERVKL